MIWCSRRGSIVACLTCRAYVAASDWGWQAAFHKMRPLLGSKLKRTQHSSSVLLSFTHTAPLHGALIALGFVFTKEFTPLFKRKR